MRFLHFQLEESTFDGDDRGRGRVDGSSRVDTGMDDSANGNDGRGGAETDDKVNIYLTLEKTVKFNHRL